MIFQVPIDLEIKNRKVQAIIDLDTGFIGFTESIEGKEIEYYYGESPVEFKKALLERLKPIFGKRSMVNFKVSGKNEDMRFVNNYLKENSKSR
jgi:hypothetical protein